jgi:hypothetical protein
MMSVVNNRNQMSVHNNNNNTNMNNNNNKNNNKSHKRRRTSTGLTVVGNYLVAESQAAANNMRTRKRKAHNRNTTRANFSKATPILVMPLEKPNNPASPNNPMNLTKPPVLTNEGTQRMQGKPFRQKVQAQRGVIVPFDSTLYDKGTTVIIVSGYTSRPTVLVKKGAPMSNKKIPGSVKVTIESKDYWISPEHIYMFDSTKNGSVGLPLNISKVSGEYKGGRARRSKTHRKRK